MSHDSIKMQNFEKLKKATSLDDLAILLGYKAKSISYIIYKIPDKIKYYEFNIPKKNGEHRKISAPNDKLKLLQQRLSFLLNDCLEVIFTKDKYKNNLSHGFRRKYSIISNANSHKNKRFVFNLDLLNFFPSINFGRVRGFFIKSNYFKLNEKVATVIAQIAIFNNELPQGSPCSPVISNLIGHILDIRMVKLAKINKCTYTRYADDLTFSTNQKSFPRNIATNLSENEWIPSECLVDDIESVGFYLNNKKTTMQYKTSRQITTGLTVNKKVNIKKEYYKNVRSMCFNLFKTNKFYINGINSKKPLDDNSTNILEGTLNQLEGMLSFIYQVKRPHYIFDEKNKPIKPTAITELYRHFLFYKNFFINEKPLIICEGKTDNIYLKCALRQLHKDFGVLVEKFDDKLDFKIKFLNFSKLYQEVLNIASGSSGLIYFINIYKEEMKRFNSEGKKNPIILVLDNDSGSKKIKNRIKQELGCQIDVNMYYNIVDNLFVLFVPNNQEGAIESLFDNNILSQKINGKIFNSENVIDIEKEYGKNIFAERIIKKNQNNINFENFRFILNQFTKIINEYKYNLKATAYN